RGRLLRGRSELGGAGAWRRTVTWPGSPAPLLGDGHGVRFPPPLGEGQGGGRHAARPDRQWVGGDRAERERDRDQPRKRCPYVKSAPSGQQRLPYTPAIRPELPLYITHRRQEGLRRYWQVK